MHKSVLLDEVIETLKPQDGETYIDATFGAGGYTQRILDSAKCKVIGIDQDPLAQQYAAEIKGDFKLVAGNFGNLDKLITEEVDGIVFDIGVSSMQLDQTERGFSFMRDGPLDMRMSQDGESAADFLNTAEEEDIANVLYKYGEERKSRRVAKSIVAHRPLKTTFDLKNAVHKAIGNSGKTDSSTKTFQAVRVYVNQELENLEKALQSALALLKNGGRIIVVTFHSLEDRIVKLFFKKESGNNESVNRHEAAFMQRDIVENEVNLKLPIRKAIKPSDIEVRDNPRARSAKLRVAVRTEHGKNIGNDNVTKTQEITIAGGNNE